MRQGMWETFGQGSNLAVNCSNVSSRRKPEVPRNYWSLPLNVIDIKVLYFHCLVITWPIFWNTLLNTSVVYLFVINMFPRQEPKKKKKLSSKLMIIKKWRFRQIALYGMVLHFIVWYFMVQSSIYIADLFISTGYYPVITMRRRISWWWSKLILPSKIHRRESNQYYDEVSQRNAEKCGDWEYWIDVMIAMKISICILYAFQSQIDVWLNDPSLM